MTDQEPWKAEGLTTRESLCVLIVYHCWGAKIPPVAMNTALINLFTLNEIRKALQFAVKEATHEGTSH